MFDENTTFMHLTSVEKNVFMYFSSVFCSIKQKEMALCQALLRVIGIILAVQHMSITLTNTKARKG